MCRERSTWNSLYAGIRSTWLVYLAFGFVILGLGVFMLIWMIATS
ncbi:MAG TPA: hypothetical protein VGY57_07915 [Vicinamibacterales bacterium]|nr:hypothetical protein [Vicinamibacterales bacterium]